jgi:hypothetical protein
VGTKTVKFPAVWKQLLKAELTDDHKKGKHRKSLEDPEPYREDVRSISGRLSDGTPFEVALCSGDSNYWLEVLLYNNKGYTEYDEALEDLPSDGVIEVEMDVGDVTHSIKLEEETWDTQQTSGVSSN